MLCLSALALGLTACAGLAGEPEILAVREQPLPLPTPAISDIPPVQAISDSVPARPPDLFNGALIYAVNCAACHGRDGRGDGELYLSGQIPFPGNLREPDSARRQTPQEWYDIITRGRIENLMPPWESVLTEQERWDVAMYTYTLHYTTDQQARGRVLYEDCADCHGETGRGDGELVLSGRAGDVKDLTSQRAMVTLSDRAIFTMIREGIGEVMPAYPLYSDDDIWAVVAHTRLLSLANAPALTAPPDAAQIDAPPAPQATPEVHAPTVTRGDISGQIANLSAGGGLPPVGTIVSLRVFDPVGFSPVEDRQATLDADYRFTFADVPLEPEHLYLAVVRYQGRDYASGFAEGAQLLADPDLSIDIYELTDDIAAVQITGLVIQVRVIGDNVEISQFTQFRNTSDRVFTSLTPDENGLYPSVVIGLPVAAIVLDFDDPGGYVLAQDNLSAYSIRPLFPGEERLTAVTYLVQYGGGAVIDFPLIYALEGQARLLLHPPDTLTLTSEQLPSLNSEQTLSGIRYAEYGGFASFPPGESLRFEISGQGIPSTLPDLTAPLEVVDSNTLPLVLGGIMALIALLIGAALAVSRRGGGTDARQAVIDRLLAQIAELDTQHDAGTINHDVYQRQRAELKARLAVLLENALDSAAPSDGGDPR